MGKVPPGWGDLLRGPELLILLALDESWSAHHRFEPKTEEEFEKLLDELLSSRRQKAAARSPRNKHRERRADELTRAADALKRLRKANPVRRHTLDDIATESGIPKTRLRKLTLARIRRAAR